MHTLDICLCDNVKINLISFSISHQQFKTGVWLIAIPYICDNLCKQHNCIKVFVWIYEAWKYIGNNIVCKLLWGLELLAYWGSLDVY